MKRTILSALLTSAGLSAATVSGVVHDSNGAPVAEAKVMIYNPDTAATKQEKATDADGKFSFSGSGTGQYILQIEKAGLSSIFREFDLKADSEMDREFTMSPEGMPLVADKPITSTAATGKDGQQRKVSIGGGVAQSNLLTKTTPVYPVAAKKAGTQGTVEIEATISKDGIPTELRVVSSPSDELSSNALEAVRKWRYRPTLLNGNPVMVVTTVILNYTLLQ